MELTSATTEEIATIPLSGIPSARYVVMLPAILLIGGEAILLTGYVLGFVSLGQALMWLPFGLLILGAWAIAMWLAGKGTVALSSNGVWIKAANGTREVAWRDIAEITSESSKPLGGAGDAGAITLRLTRPLRVGLLTFGTDIIGVPTHIKTVRFRVAEPSHFIRLAERFRPSTYMGNG